MNNNLLAANIAAENRVNAYIRAVAPKMFEALKPFLGQKVVLATGELSAKVKKAMEPFVGWKPAENMQIYCYSSKYSLVYAFKILPPAPNWKRRKRRLRRLNPSCRNSRKSIDKEFRFN